ncbi:MAG: IS200/IS605 family transposase [Calditrichaceae bacterium]|nr:IS200/IS605 family transposase [Calditrichia bacterium]NUQ42289.1 IS200/IS605 family transposase [Calditrichaceae bacterium]
MSTFTQLYIHIVFATRDRAALLDGEKKTRVYQYVTGIIKNLGHKLIIINGMADHVHILIGLAPDKTISDLVKEVKRSSTNFINEQRWFPGKFAWQEGYGAFSYGQSQLQTIIGYIRDQETHHQSKNFREEYLSLLKNFEVEFDEKWIP